MRHPEHTALLDSLRAQIETLTEVLHAGLLIHAKHCLVEMRPFHATLQKFFVRNVRLLRKCGGFADRQRQFAEEIRRLPPATLAELELASSLHANGHGPLNLELSSTTRTAPTESLPPSLASSPVTRTDSKLRYSLQLVPPEVPSDSGFTNGTTPYPSDRSDHSKSQSSFLSRLNSGRKPSLGSIKRFGSLRRKTNG
jgi:hypothetical protein